MNKDKIQKIVFAIAENNRKKMIDVIMLYSGEEYETREELIDLAIKNDEQLRYILNHLVDYYLNED
jgi:hypothetical protein